MKTFALVVTALVTLAFLSGCEGPAGPAGADGEDGLNLEGFAVGIQCATCHSADTDTLYYVAGRVYQWESSKHALGGDIERNGPDCAGCHTTEGFVQATDGKTVGQQTHPSPPGCFACHSPHARNNFSLRKQTPVTIGSNIVGVPDAVFDYGKGNLCAQCHKTRPMSPKMDANPPGDSLVITTSRWYSHYGVQGQVLMGDGGFKFPDFTYTGNSPHTNNTIIKQEGCPTCHMAEGVYPPSMGTGKGGGHTMNIRFDFNGTPGSVLNGCKQSGCHTSALTSVDYHGVQTAVEHNLDTLGTLLANKGWIDLASGTVKLTGGRLVIRPAVKAGAICNFLFIEHDLSLGVHNSTYALELLRSSIAELRKP